MAAVPESESQLKTLITNVVAIYEQSRGFAAVNNVAGSSGKLSISNMVALQATFDGSLVGTQLPATAAEIRDTRDNLVKFLKSAKPALEELFVEYGKLLNYRGTDFKTQWPNVFRNYSENGKYVTSRGFVFGAVSAAGSSLGSNVGNGTINRLNFDQYGNVIENTWADTKTARCIADASSTASLQEEKFTLYGTPAGRDLLEEVGSGRVIDSPLVGISARTSTKFGLLNPSFSSGSIANGDLGGWTSTQTLGGTALAISATNYELHSDLTPYRGYQGDTTPQFLRVLTAASSFCLSQNLEANGANFLPGVPYYFHVAIRRKNSATGTFTLRVGKASTQVSLASLANDVWTLVKIQSTYGSPQNWFKYFGNIAPSSTIPQVTLSLECPNLAVGQLDIDDASIGAYQVFDGLWYAAVGGSIPFAYEDSFTFTDNEYGSAGGGGVGPYFAVDQKWLWRGPGVYLPGLPAPAPSSMTWGQGFAGGGSVDAGNHNYVVTLVDANGVESGFSAALLVTVGGSHTVTFAINMTLPTNIVSGKLYRSKAATTSPYFLVSALTLAQLTGSAFNDAIADASLGAQASSVQVNGVTLLDPT